MKNITLGVNIDHVAVLREARRVNDPEIMQALFIASSNGADQITIHLREDRRHIQDADAKKIIQSSPIPVNLECSVNKKILNIVSNLKPHRATLVPEKREEITTEGGLDVVNFSDEIAYAVEQLHDSIIPVSLFVDPTKEAMKISKELGAEMVELHTGSFANIYAMLHSALPYSHHSIKELELPRYELSNRLEESIEKIKDAAIYANKLGLEVAAGHGLNYYNVHLIKKIEEITELNIGQSIIAKSVFTGLAQAIQEMKRAIQR